MHMDNFSHIGSNKDFDHRAPSAVDPLMTGTLQSGVSTQPTLMMQNGAGPLMMSGAPSIISGMPMGGVPASGPASVVGAPGSVIGAPGSVIGAPAPVLSHMPMGLPPGTPSTSRVGLPAGVPVSSMGLPMGMTNGVPVSVPVSMPVSAPIMSQQLPLPPIPNGMPKNFSTDSIGDQGRSSRPVTPPLQTSRPVTPTQPQPMGLPNGRGKLVPGRMSNQKIDTTRQRRDIPSTAV